MKFDQYVQNEATHKKVLHDVKLALGKDEVQNNFDAIAKDKFDAQRHAKALTAQDLPGH